MLKKAIFVSLLGLALSLTGSAAFAQNDGEAKGADDGTPAGAPETGLGGTWSK